MRSLEQQQPETDSRPAETPQQAARRLVDDGTCHPLILGPRRPPTKSKENTR